MNILQQIKELQILDGIQATLSISFSKDGETLDEKYRWEQAVQEIALGRGGDQAIIKQDQKYEFFGGRTEATIILKGKKKQNNTEHQRNA